MEPSSATRLVVAGVNSVSTARQVEAELSAVAGVEQVRVDPGTHVVVVRHSEAVTAADLLDALEQAGFHARRALPGEGSAAYASSPWGALRPEGRSPLAEVALDRFLTLLGLF